MESCIDKYSVAPCCLCGSSELNATYFCALNAVEKSFIERHHGSLPDDRAHICKKHQLEAKRYHEDYHYVPKWKGNETKQIIQCTFPNCTSTSETTKISVATFAPLELILSIIGMAESSKGEVFLCKSHYNEAYKCVNRVPCAVCQAYPKCGKYFNRHSPDAETISSIFGIGLTCDDVLCLICYKAH